MFVLIKFLKAEGTILANGLLLDLSGHYDRQCLTVLNSMWLSLHTDMSCIASMIAKTLLLLHSKLRIL